MEPRDEIFFAFIFHITSWSFQVSHFNKRFQADVVRRAKRIEIIKHIDFNQSDFVHIGDWNRNRVVRLVGGIIGVIKIEKGLGGGIDDMRDKRGCCLVPGRVARRRARGFCDSFFNSRVFADNSGLSL